MAKSGPGGTPAGRVRVPGREQSMEELRESTVEMLTDYMRHCARLPGTPPWAPPTFEAAILRHAADHQRTLCRVHYYSIRSYQGDYIHLIAEVALELLAGTPITWDHLVDLVALAGTLLERPFRGVSMGPEQWSVEATQQIELECRFMANVLCTVLMELQGTWLMAQGGWDGFCLFYINHIILPSYWIILLILVYVLTVVINLWVPQ